MIAADPSPPKPDVICFIDEAGDRGYLRNLTAYDDDKISVLCALPVPAEHLDDVRSVVSPLYREFVTAAPPGAKLHITDAFKPGNEAWAAVARDVRRRLFYDRSLNFSLMDQL
jgi:hypothetical protein